jgi:surface protein
MASSYSNSQLEEMDVSNWDLSKTETLYEAFSDTAATFKKIV